MGDHDNSHKQWTQGKKPSMKRRSEVNNYTERGIYLVTVAIEGRRPLLGTLAGRADVQEGPDKPHVVLSPWGERVRDEWFGIPRYYPQIEVIRLCIMPDHIHGILFVHEKIERHLGHVINGFKGGTRRAARELGIITEAKPQLTKPTTPPVTPPTTPPTTPPVTPPTTPPVTPPTTPPVTPPTAPPVVPPTAPPVVPPVAPPVAPPTAMVPYTEAQPQPNSYPKHAAIGTLWEPGYNDRILLHKGQLQRMLAYLDDNPRRLLLKRQHPEYFTRLAPLTAVGVQMQAMGNATLLTQCLKMLRLQCSRHLYQQEIDKEREKFLAAGRAGTTIISACFSDGEQQISTACITAGIPFIVLLVHGFPPYYKPAPLYLQACAEGRLLLLSPFQWQNEKITNMRQRCLYLNDLAQRICDEVNNKAQGNGQHP